MLGLSHQTAITEHQGIVKEFTLSGLLAMLRWKSIVLSTKLRENRASKIFNVNKRYNHKIWMLAQKQDAWYYLSFEIQMLMTYSKRFSSMNSEKSSFK